jgi:hypothetical protein
MFSENCAPIVHASWNRASGGRLRTLSLFLIVLG